MGLNRLAELVADTTLSLLSFPVGCPRSSFCLISMLSSYRCVDRKNPINLMPLGEICIEFG